jgi:putative peptidoglycan lipid II flippase
VVKILSPAFYALGRSRTPAAVGVASVLLNATLSFTTAPYFGFRGIALSASVAALFNAGMLAVLLRRSLGGLELARVTSTLGKVLVAGTAMAATAWWGEQWLTAVAPGTSLIAQAVRLGGAMAAAVAVLGLGAQLLAIREFEDVRDAVLKRLRRMSGRA